MNNTYKIDFPIYLPATPDKAAKQVSSIKVDVYLDEDGDEMLTNESSQLIEETRAHYLGLMNGSAIKDMRQRLGFKQTELSELLACGKKSLSRWETGKGYPSNIVNKILRLLDEGYITAADLRAVDGPRRDISWRERIVHLYPKKAKPFNYDYSFDEAKPATEIGSDPIQVKYA